MGSVVRNKVIKKNMKKLIFLLLFATAAQSQAITGFVGYKAGEIDFTLEKELIYGLGVSLIDANIVGTRANKYDRDKFHQAQRDVTPTVFLLLGGKIDQITVVGKLGMSHFEESIDGNRAGQKLYSTVGLQIGYHNFFGNFDTCNSLMLGYKIEFKM
jgi:hypothetical protein